MILEEKRCQEQRNRYFREKHVASTGTAWFEEITVTWEGNTALCWHRWAVKGWEEGKKTGLHPTWFLLSSSWRGADGETAAAPPLCLAPHQGSCWCSRKGLIASPGMWRPWMCPIQERRAVWLSSGDVEGPTSLLLGLLPQQLGKAQH